MALLGGAGIAAGAAIVAFGVNAVKSAASLGEAVNQSNVVFEGSAKQMEAWAETSAQAFGMSKTAALQAASGFGLMLQAAGLATAESAKMSQALVELAGDLASFKDVDPSVALEKLRGGLAGEAEPLRQFGIFLSEAAVQAKAMEMGISSASGELTDAQKIQARYAIILEQTTKAQGDFGRTADSLPNQMRSLKAEFENISAEVGQKLLPVAINLIETLRDLVPVLKLVGEALAATTGYAADLVGALMLNDSGFAQAQAAAERLFGQYDQGKITIIELENELMKINEQTGVLIEVSDEYSRALATARDNQERGTQAAMEWNQIMAAQEEATGGTSESVEELGKATQRFGNMSVKAFKEFKEGLVESLQVTAGEFEKFNDAFDTTPKELAKQLKLAVEIARTSQRDLREIFADKSLSTEQQKALAELPANQRHAWAEAGKEAKNQIEKSAVDLARANSQGAKSAANAARQPAEQGGREIGSALMSGAIKGIIEGSPAVAAAAATAVRKAIDAAKAAAGSHSPSTVMAELGKDMIDGLVQGLEKEQHRLEQAMGIIEQQLDRLKGRAGEVASAVSGGFGQFLEFGPTEEGGFAGPNLAGAQQFAQSLQALRRQGAGPALLSEAAGMDLAGLQQLLQLGPAQIQLINKQYNAILELQKKTGERLSESYFGQRIDQLQETLRGVRQDLRESEKVVVNVQGWVGNDQELARKIRDALLDLKGSRVSLGLG